MLGLGEQRFFIELAVVGSPSAVMQAAVPALQEEIDQRDYLRAGQVYWDTDTQRVIVDIEDQGHDSQQVARIMAEELFEITAAVLGDFERFHVDIVAAYPKGTPDTPNAG